MTGNSKPGSGRKLDKKNIRGLERRICMGIPVSQIRKDPVKVTRSLDGMIDGHR